MTSPNPSPGLGSVKSFVPAEDPPQSQLAPGWGFQQVQCDVSQLCANFLGVSRKMTLAAHAWVTGLGPSSVLKFLPLFWDGIESKMLFLSIATTGKHKVKAKLIFSKSKLTGESCLHLVTARQMSKNHWESQCPYVISHAVLVFAVLHMFLPPCPRPSRLQGWEQPVPLKTAALHHGSCRR